MHNIMSIGEEYSGMMGKIVEDMLSDRGVGKVWGKRKFW